MSDISSNPDVISSRIYTAISLSLIALLSLGNYVQAAANRQIQDNVVYGNSDLGTSGTVKNVEKSKENDKVIGHLQGAGADNLSVRDKHNDNSPALNTFLENVLKAQNELKWIDQAVRHVDTGEKRLDRFQSRFDRFGRRSDPNSKNVYQARIRVKRDLEQAKSPDASWVPQKKRYGNDYRGFPERIYLDDELKFKRDVNPEDFQEDTMNLWASASNDNLDSVGGSYKKVADTKSRDERHLDSKHRMLARVKNSAASQNPEEASGNGAMLEEDPPSLESLKKVVLELSKSLGEPDTKTEAREESVGVLKSKNGERHVEEMTGRKEGASKGEHERDASSSQMNQDSEKVEENNFEKNYETNSKWWDDPRSAAEIFNFKRRDDDLEDDEEDEELNGRNSEFDYVMRRVKRDRNYKNDDEENGNGVGVFYRAGFGEYYPNDGSSISRRFRRDSREDPGVLIRDVDERVDTENYNDKDRRAINVNSEEEKVPENDSRKNEDSKFLRNMQDQEKNFKDKKVGVNVEEAEINDTSKKDYVRQEEFSRVRNKKEIRSDEDWISSKSLENEGSNGNSVEPENLNSNNNKSLKLASAKTQLEAHDTRENKMDENSKISDTAKGSPKGIIQDTSNVKRKEEKNMIDLKKIEKSDPENKVLEGPSLEDPHNKKSKDEDTLDVWHVPENGEKVENPSKDNNDDKKRSTAKSQEASTSKRPEETLARICQVEEELSDKNGASDNIPGKLISTIFDIKVQKVEKLGSDNIAEDISPKDESLKEDKMRLRDVFDLYKDKDNLRNIEDSKVNQDGTSAQDSSNTENRVQQNGVSEDESKDHVKSGYWYVDVKGSQEKKEKEAAWHKEMSENGDPKDNIKEGRNYPEKNQEEKVNGPASEKLKYQDKEYNQEKSQSLSSKSMDGDVVELSEGIKDFKKDAAKGLNYKDTKRKLLWVTSMLRNLEIRDGRRDSGWDQKESGKHEQGPINVKENFKAISLKDAAAESEAGSDFKDELKSTKDLAPAYTQRRKRKILQEAENSPEFQGSQLASNNLPDASAIKKRSQHPKNIPGPQEDPNLNTGVKRPEGSEDDYEGVNEDIENIIQGYVKDKSEIDNQDSDDFERDERSLSANERNPLRDRVNMLIRQRIDTKAKDKDSYRRKRRYPLGTIEYYDYDSDSGEYEKDSPAIENDQKSAVQQQQQSNSSAKDQVGSCKSKIVPTKKDENSEEEERVEKQLEKLKNKLPKQEFIADVNLGKGHRKINNMTMTCRKVPCGPPTTKATSKDEKKMSNEDSGTIDQSDDNVYRGSSEGDSRVQWLGQPAEADLDPRDQNRINELENRRHVILTEPLEYSLNVHGKLEPEAIGAFLGEGSPVKQRLLDRSRNFQLTHGILSDYEGRRHQDHYHLNEAEEEVQPTYEELEKINEWKQSDIRERPRIRGDQRIFSGPKVDAEMNRDRADTYSDRAARRNWYSKEPDSANLDQTDLAKSSSHLEQFDEQISKGRRFLKEARDEVPKHDSQNMLKRESVIDSSSSTLAQNRLVEPSAYERTYLVISPAQLSGPSNPDSLESSSSSSSGSNYLALKITDDMFKGGIEQSNPAEEKTPEILGPLKTTTEWKVIKVMDNKDNTLLTSPCHIITKEKHNSIVQTDSRSPYENQRILESPVPENDYDKNIQDRSSVGSKDLMHESFVDPLDLESEYDLRIRLGRELMAMDDPELEDLHSFSYPADDLRRTPTRRAAPELEWQEAPVEKYLKNTQDQFFQDGVDQSLIGRTFVDREYLRPEKKEDRIKREVSIDSNDPSMMNFENLETRIDIPHDNQESKLRNRIGKGLTNIEEWEMNAPILQKHVVFASDHGLDAKRIKDSIVPVSINRSNIDNDLYAFEKTSSTSDFAKGVNTTLLNRDKRNLNYNEGIPGSSGSFGAKNFMENDNFMNNFLRENGKENAIRQARIPVIFENTENRIFPGYEKKFDFYGERKKNIQDVADVNVKNGFSSNNLKPNLFGQTHVRDYNNPFVPWSESSRESAWFRDRNNFNNYKKTVRSTNKQSRSKDSHRKHSKIRNSDNFRKRNHRKHHPSSHLKKTRNNILFKNSKNHSSRANFKSPVSSLTGNLVVAKEAVNTVDKHPLSPTECNKILESQMSMTDTDKRVLNENAQDQSTQKPEDDSQKKKFTILLAPDNMEDESQMDLALHGELAGKIVEKIFDQVQGNEALKVALGPGLYRKHKPQDAITSDKIYRQGLDEDEVKHTETMMRRVMELLGRLILDEVQRKTCASLPLDMRDFLQWMLGIEQEESFSDQAPPLPLVHDQDVPHHAGDKFLFRDPSHHEMNADVNELYKKVRLLKSLINEYNALTQKEKTKVQTVHDYLVRQLALLVQYIEAKEAEEANGNKILTNDVGSASPQHILQYQNAMPNSSDNNNNSNDTRMMGTISPLMNTHSIMRLSNATFQLNDNISNQRPIFLSGDKRREVRSSERLPRKFRKRKRKRKRNRKHRKHKHSANQSPEYRKLIRRIALLRQKRANSLYQDNWDPFKSEYEEPIIYSASGMLRSDFGHEKREAWNGEKIGESEKKYGQNNFEKENSDFFNTVPAGRYNEDYMGREQKFGDSSETDLRNRIQRKAKFGKKNRNSQNSYADRSANSKNDAFKKEIEKNFKDNLHTYDSPYEYYGKNAGLDDFDYGNDISKIVKYDHERENLDFDHFDGTRYDASLTNLQKYNSPESYSKKKREVNNMNNNSQTYENFQNQDNIQKTNERKRDVLSTSINLQPWLNPKSNDESTSDFLKKFSNLLVHTSNGISTMEEAYKGEGEKRDALKVYEAREPSDPVLSSGRIKNVKRSLAEDEVVLLNKREAWRRKNEQQLEEVAFGKDMRSRRSKEEFEKLAELEKRKKELEDAGGRRKRQDESEDESKMAEDFGKNTTVENSSELESACHGAGTEKDLEMKCKAVDVEKPKNEEKSENLMTMEVNIFQVVPANSTKKSHDHSVPEERRKNPVDYLKNIEEKINVYSDEDVTEHSKLEKSTKQNLEKGQDNWNVPEKSKIVYENESSTKNQIFPKNSQKNTIEDDPSETSQDKETSIQRSRKNIEKFENDVQEATDKTSRNFSKKSLVMAKRSLDEKQFQDTEQNFQESQNDKIIQRKSRANHNKNKSANKVPYFNYPSSNEDQLKKNADSVQKIVKRNEKFASDKNLRSRKIYFKSKHDPAAILPLLEVSEQRQMQSQASRAQKDDQRDIADQMLGLEAP